MKDLTTVKEGKATAIQDRSGKKKKKKKPYRDTESMDRIRRMLLGKKVPLYVTALYYTV